MALRYITETDLAGKGVAGQPDVPGLTAAQMQAKVEQVVREVVIPAFNENVTGQNAANTARYTKTETDQAIAARVQAVGAGDMAQNMYDPRGVQTDVFAAIPGKNLLDNADFASPVNQRGQTVCTTPASYWLDRWKTGSGSFTCTLYSKYIKVEGDGTAVLSQRLLPDVLQSGESYTVSLWDNTGNRYAGTAAAPAGGATAVFFENSNFRCSLTRSAETQKWFFNLACLQPVCRVAAVKLEAGTAPTPFVPKGFGAELQECRRYYQVADLRQLAGRAYTTGKAELVFNLCPPMLALPTVTLPQNFVIYDGAASFAAAYLGSAGSGNVVRVLVTATGLSVYRIYTNSNPVELSAEL